MDQMGWPYDSLDCLLYSLYDPESTTPLILKDWLWQRDINWDTLQNIQ